MLLGNINAFIGVLLYVFVYFVQLNVSFLAVADEWEKVAHRGVSISTHIMDVSQLVICWRKLELAYWKNLLQVHLAR